MSDRQIRQAAKCGATRVRDLARDLGVGTCCGKCLPEAQATLSASLAANSGNVATGYMLPA